MQEPVDRGLGLGLGTQLMKFGARKLQSSCEGDHYAESCQKTSNSGPQVTEKTLRRNSRTKG